MSSNCFVSFLIVILSPIKKDASTILERRASHSLSINHSPCAHGNTARYIPRTASRLTDRDYENCEFDVQFSGIVPYMLVFILYFICKDSISFLLFVMLSKKTDGAMYYAE